MDKNIKETLFSPINREDYEAMYKLIAHDLIKNGVGSTHLGYLEILYKQSLLTKGE